MKNVHILSGFATSMPMEMRLLSTVRQATLN